MDVCECICTYVCVYMYVLMCTYVCMYVCMWMRTYMGAVRSKSKKDTKPNLTVFFPMEELYIIILWYVYLSEKSKIISDRHACLQEVLNG